MRARRPDRPTDRGRPDGRAARRPGRRRILAVARGLALGALGALVLASPTTAQLVAEYRLDGSGWDGTADEILDASGNGHHGVVRRATSPGGGSGPAPGNPGTCGYAELSNGSIGVSGLPVSTAYGDKTTVAFWMYWNGSNNMMPIGWNIHDIWFFGGSMGFNSGGGDIYGISSAGLAGAWHHVVAEFTNGQLTNNRLWIDGVEQSLSQRRNSPVNSRAYVGSEFRIGGWAYNNGYRWTGSIDEVRIYSGTLTSSEITTIMNETHPCGVVTLPTPIAQWRFDELAWDGTTGEVVDSFGGNDGTAFSGATTVEGKLCRGGAFDGSDGIEIPNATALEVGKSGADYSVAYWLRYTGTQGSDWGIHLQKGASNSQLTFTSANYPNSTRLISTLSSTGSWSNYVSSTGTYPLDQWIHVTQVKSGTTVRLYVDGSLMSSRSLSGTSIHNTGSLYVGKSPWYGGVVGEIDELILFDQALSSAQVAAIHTNQDGGLEYDGSERDCSEPVGHWRFEESSWNGSAGEVADATPNGHDGYATGAATGSVSPAIAGDPGTCRFATFDGVDDRVTIPHHADLNGTDALTYTVWVRPETWSGTRQVMGKSVHGGGSGRAQMGIFSEGGNLRGRAETSSGRVQIDASLPTLDTWTHLALVFDGTSLRIFRNGSEVAQTTFSSRSLVQTTDPLVFGKRVGTDQYFYQGDLDEPRVYTTALSATAIATVMAETAPCEVVDATPHVSHDGSAQYCAPETISVTMRDAGGAVLTSWAETITLTTQESDGTWTLLTGNGSFSDGTPDDGDATYTFSAADAGTASFALAYDGASTSIDVDAIAGSQRDDDAEGDLAFVPGSFTLTANALPDQPLDPVNDPLPAQTAGTPFSLHLAAYGASCGVVESYAGDQTISFWMDHDDPGSGPRTALVDAVAIGATSGAAVDRTVTFTNGRGVVSVDYEDVGRIRLHARDATASPAISGTTNAFVVRPADLFVTEVRNAAGVLNTGVQVPTGTLFARAGEPLQVTVEARDADGDRVPSFGLESSPEGIRVAASTLVAPTGGALGTIGNPAALSPIAPAGTFRGTTLSWNEVGAVRLRASIADGDYLGTGDVSGTESGPIGRFAPDRFVVTANTPRFETACALGAFTWVGEPFVFDAGAEPVLTVRAVDAAGNTTTNYREDWWRITNGSLANRSYGVGGATADPSRLPLTTVDPDIRRNEDGTGTLTFSAGGGLAILRGSPVAPFDAEIALSIDVVDLDGTVWPSNPYTVGGTTPGAGIAFDVSKRFQFGRLHLANAHGSELVDLPVSLRTQSYDGMAFVDDTNDSCSRVPAAAISLTPSPGTLSTTATIANDPLFSGDAGLELSAPNAQGHFDVVVDLGAAGLDWLRWDWPFDGNLDGSPDDDPEARATFGIFRGRQTLIHVRETY